MHFFSSCLFSSNIDVLPVLNFLDSSFPLIYEPNIKDSVPQNLIILNSFQTSLISIGILGDFLKRKAKDGKAGRDLFLKVLEDSI